MGISSVPVSPSQGAKGRCDLQTAAPGLSCEHNRLSFAVQALFLFACRSGRSRAYPPPMLLGIDIGTSLTQAVGIDSAGALVSSAQRPHTLSMPRAGWSEQDPQEWWRATVGAVGEAEQRAGASITGIGLS